MASIRNSRNPAILVAPLHWGLGHVTRCIPLIRSLERMGARIVLASDGAALQLLKAEFPQLPAFALPAYHIRYQTKNMVWNIAQQLPRIVYAIRSEQWATERLVRRHKIAGIISDNRYGCFSRQANSVILTHQIQLRVPNAALQWMAQQLLRRALQKFDAVWVPDEAGESNLAGELSHPPLHSPPTRYLGILSRFSTETPQPTKQDQRLTIAVVLSGPEPQRTVLEQILLEQALALPQQFVFVQGKPHANLHHIVAENVEVISHLTSLELQQLLRSSQIVVCRSGYSSLMDLAALGNKKAVLIPTPGQTEQEYLADRLAREKMFVCQTQDAIELETALRAAESTAGFSRKKFDTEKFEAVLEAWLQDLT